MGGGGGGGGRVKEPLGVPVCTRDFMLPSSVVTYVETSIMGVEEALVGCCIPMCARDFMLPSSVGGGMGGGGTPGGLLHTSVCP